MITPIFIPTPSYHGEPEPDNKCPKCGFEWDDPTGGGGTWLPVLIFAILLVLFLYVACFLGSVFMDMSMPLEHRGFSEIFGEAWVAQADFFRRLFQ